MKELISLSNSVFLEVNSYKDNYETVKDSETDNIELNYKELLEKYVKHIKYKEGIDYTDTMFRSRWEKELENLGLVFFTEGEINYIKSVKA